MAMGTVCHVHAPDSCAAAEVEDPLRVLDGCEMQLVSEKHQKHVMRNVELVVLEFVIWAPVLALTELVISSTILVAMFPDGRRYGCCVAQMVRIPIS